MSSKAGKPSGTVQPLGPPSHITPSILSAYECAGCLDSSLSLKKFKDCPTKVFCDQECFEEYLINNIEELKITELQLEAITAVEQGQQLELLSSTNHPAPSWILHSIPGYTLVKCLGYGLLRTSIPISILRDKRLLLQRTTSSTNPPAPQGFLYFHNLFTLLTLPDQEPSIPKHPSAHPPSSLPRLARLLSYTSHQLSKQDYFEFLDPASLQAKTLSLVLREIADGVLTQQTVALGIVPDDKLFGGVYDCAEELFDFGEPGEVCHLLVDNSRKEDMRFRVTEDETAVYELHLVCTDLEFKRITFFRVKKEIFTISKDKRDFVFVDAKSLKVIDPKERISDYKNAEIRIARLAKSRATNIKDFKNLPVLYHILPGGGYLFLGIPALSSLEEGAAELSEKIDAFCDFGETNTATSSPSKEGKSTPSEAGQESTHSTWFTGNLKQKIIDLPQKDKDKGNQFINILDHTEFNKERKVFWKKPSKNVVQIKQSDSLGLFADVFAKKHKPISRPTSSPKVLIVEVRDPERPTPQLWGDMTSEILFAEDDASPIYELMSVIHQNPKNKEYTCMVRSPNGGLGNERGMFEVPLSAAKGGKYFIFEKSTQSASGCDLKQTGKVKPN